MADWLAADWPAPPGVQAGTTLRSGGVSSGAYESLNLGDHVGDDPDDVAENQRLFAKGCGLPAPPQWLKQAHGNACATLPEQSPVPAADAAVTQEAGIVCAVLTADCLPVVFARRDGSAVGVAHAGWRGLCAGVLEATAAALGSPAELQAWLGPAISMPEFEVGHEVLEAFVSRDPAAATCFAENEAGRWQADLFELARQRLAAAGIGPVYGGGTCTYQQKKRFFSYRRDGQCGRMATFVWRSA